MRIVFLDIDGVLNSTQYFLRQALVDAYTSIVVVDPDARIDPLAVARLNQITDQTGAVIVVTSTWRLSYTNNLAGLQQLLASHSVMAPVIGMTDDTYASRGKQIDDWINDHPDVTNFIILDDDTDMGTLTPRLIKTTFQDGLQDIHVQKSIQMLTD